MKLASLKFMKHFVDIDDRLRSVQSKCAMLYDNCITPWISHKDELSTYFKGNHIVDIGCGHFGGLAKLANELEAESFLGIDINHTFIRLSRRRRRNAHYVCDDPISVLQDLRKPSIIVSSGLFDTTIIRNMQYAKDLIYAIYAATKIEGITIHSACNFHKVFGKEFQNVGFKDLKKGYSQDFCVYIKEKRIS